MTSSVQKSAAAAACCALVLFCLFVSKWSFGHVSAVGADNVEVARFGADLAPSDPEAHFAYASALEKTLLPADQAAAIGEYERAAALSPNNYLYWLAVSRAREQAGNTEGAETAARRASVLAPNYSRVRWALGNVLLRAGRQEEAFEEFRAAAQADQGYAGPAVSAIWQLMGGDLARITAATNGSPRMNAAVALTLASNNRFTEAAKVWSGIPAGERAELKGVANIILEKMLQGGRYRSAVEVAAGAGLLADGEVGVGRISNGGFESAFASENANQFSWVIADGNNPRVGLNENRTHSGTYSLLLSFGPGGSGSRPVTQRVAVEPGGSYRLRSFYFSELKTAGKLNINVTTPGGHAIAKAEIGPAADWKEIAIPFNVPADEEGVIIKIAVDDCPEGRCTPNGNVWMDDFVLERSDA